MKILITEKIAKEGIEHLLMEGAQVDERLNMPREELLDIIENYNALIVRSATKVDKELLERALNLKVIGRAGNGLDNIDTEYTKANGIDVVNTPDANSIAVAEHTIGLLIANCRNITQADASSKGKKWERARFMGIELFGKTIGIVGLGRIGGLVVERLRGFGMRMIAFDPYVTKKEMAEMGIIKIEDINELMKEADYVTIHMPRNGETLGMIGEEQFKVAKKGLRIVNCARGGLVDEIALANALKEGIVAGAAIDVFAEEPNTTSPLLDFENVIVTPHLGASTTEAQINAGLGIAQNVVKALKKDLIKLENII